MTTIEFTISMGGLVAAQLVRRLQFQITSSRFTYLMDLHVYTCCQNARNCWRRPGAVAICARIPVLASCERLGGSAGWIGDQERMTYAYAKDTGEVGAARSIV